MVLFGPVRLFFKVQNKWAVFGQCPVIFRSFCLGIKENKESFAVSYLVDSLGFSQDKAILASRKLKFENPDGPNAVLDLFRDHGFSESQISKLFRCYPVLLASDPKKTLLPKIEFFYSAGFTRTQVAKLFSSKPVILSSSLKNTIIPWYYFLKRFLLSNEKVFAAWKSPSWACYGDVEERVTPNIAFLRQLGMPESRIAQLLCIEPGSFVKKPEELKELVDKVIEMGFHQSKSTFVIALVTFSHFTMSTLERKKSVYRRYGWSENDIQMAFRVYPYSLCLSEKKIITVMDFLVKRMGWPMKEIVRNPIVLSFSLEKRISPRCFVIQVLVSKGLIVENVSLVSTLKPTEKNFLRKYVTSFEQAVPQLLGVYQGKVSASELVGKI